MKLAQLNSRQTIFPTTRCDSDASRFRLRRIWNRSCYRHQSWTPLCPGVPRSRKSCFLWDHRKRQHGRLELAKPSACRERKGAWWYGRLAAKQAAQKLRQCLYLTRLDGTLRTLSSYCRVVQHRSRQGQALKLAKQKYWNEMYRVTPMAKHNSAKIWNAFRDMWWWF